MPNIKNIKVGDIYHLPEKDLLPNFLKKKRLESSVIKVKELPARGSELVQMEAIEKRNTGRTVKVIFEISLEILGKLEKLILN